MHHQIIRVKRVCVHARNNKKVLNPWIPYWFWSSWDHFSSEIQMVRSRFTAVHISPALFGGSQMPRRMEGIFPTWVGFPTLVNHGKGQFVWCCPMLTPQAAFLMELGHPWWFCGDVCNWERWEDSLRGWGREVASGRVRKWVFGAIGKGWHWRVFNIHVMYDNHAWKIKNTSFTPKSNTRDPGPIGKGSNFFN